MSVDYTRDGGMLVLTLGSGWMRGRIMCREVIVRCIVAVDPQSDSGTVYWSKTEKMAKTVQSALATYHRETNPRRGRSSSESADTGVQRKKRRT
jgi:hypothetical protein